MNNVIESKKRISFILAVTGHYELIEGALAASLHSLQIALESIDAEVIIVTNGNSWDAVPLLQTLPAIFASYVHLRCRSTAQPAALLSEGAQHATCPFMMFLSPGCLLNSEVIVRALDELDGSDYGACAALTDEWRLLDIAPNGFNPTFLTYFQSCHNLFDLCQAILRTHAFYDAGELNTQPILQRYFEAEFWLRFLHSGNTIQIREERLCSAKWNWAQYPLESELRVSHYVAQAYMLRSVLDSSDEPAQVLPHFVADLPIREGELVNQLTGSAFETSSSAHKVAIVGGIWDYVHNHLTFYNYFSTLVGTGNFTHIRAIDSIVNPSSQLRDVAAVLICRGRHPNVLRILDFCEQRNIPTVYMLDDNWFWIARDWSDYAGMFSPGKSDYDTFISCIQRCDTIVVYNPLLEQDVAQYNKNVVRLPLSINQADFEKPLSNTAIEKALQPLLDWRQRTSGLIVGYAGSPRYDSVAFQALADVARDHEARVRVLLFGNLAAEHVQLFRDPVILPYVDYSTYASIMTYIQPNILTAPLDDSRTSQSKCPNKFLEYSVIGAAGVYSNVEPYTDVVRNNENGLLVDNTYNQWKDALLRLINDDHLRHRISERAQQDVLTNFNRQRAAHLFGDMLSNLIDAKLTAAPHEHTDLR